MNELETKELDLLRNAKRAKELGDEALSQAFIAKAKAIGQGAQKPFEPTKELYPDPTGLRNKSAVSKFILGAGNSAQRAGLGIGQIVGMVSPEDVDKQAAQFLPLKHDPAFNTGDFIGNMTLPAATFGKLAQYGGMVPKIGGFLSGLGKMATTPEGLFPALGGGAFMGALQPVGSGDDRMNNIAMSMAAGGAIPAAQTAAGIGKFGFDIFREPTHQRMAGDILTRASSLTPDDMLRRIDDAAPIFPGYENTLPESLVGDSGMASFYGTQASKDPFGTGVKTRLGYKEQELQNAIMDRIQQYAGSPEKRKALTQEIADLTQELYAKGKALNVPVTQELTDNLVVPVAKESGDYMRKAFQNERRDLSPTMIDILSGKPVLPTVNSVTMTYGKPNVTGEDLQAIKIGINDLRNKQIDSSSGSALKTMIKSMDKAERAISENMPEPLREADKIFSGLKRKEAQMNIFDRLYDKQNAVLKDTDYRSITPNAFSRQVDNSAQLAQDASGWLRAGGIDEILTPEQLQAIAEAEKALQVRAIINKQAAAKGSPTGQNEVGRNFMANMTRTLGLPKWMPDSALEKTLLWLPDKLMTPIEENIQQLIADAIDPKIAAELIKKSIASSSGRDYQGLLKYGFLPSIAAENTMSN